MSCIPGVPIIVAKQSFLAQTASLPTTTVYTPSEDGDYRLVIYQVLTDPVPSWGGSISTTIIFTDELRSYTLAGVCNNGSLESVGTPTPQLNGGLSLNFHVAANQPIQISTYFGRNTNSPDQVYDLFITVVKE